MKINVHYIFLAKFVFFDDESFEKSEGNDNFFLRNTYVKELHEWLEQVGLRHHSGFYGITRRLSHLKP